MSPPQGHHPSRQNPLRRYVHDDQIVGTVCGPNDTELAIFKVTAELPGLVRGTLVTAPINRGPQDEPRFMLGQVIGLNRNEDGSLKGTLLILSRYEFRDGRPVAIYAETSPPAHPELYLFLAPPALIRECLTLSDITYPGTLLGPQALPAPVRLPHFAPVVEGGIGEAWHGGIFGPTGSGKTVAMATILGLWARHPQMGLLILDPQGQFTHDTFAEKTGLPFRFHDLVATYRHGRFSPTKHCVGLNQIRLEGLPLFLTQLESYQWYETLGIQPSKIPQAQLCLTTLFESLQRTTRWEPGWSWEDTCALRVTLPPSALHPDPEAVPFYDVLAESLSGIESLRRGHKLMEDIQDRIASPILNAHILRAWDLASEPFRVQDEEGRLRAPLSSILSQVLYEGATAIINTSPRQPGMNKAEGLRFHLIHTVLREMRELANESGQAGRAHANCLLVIDEAAELAPQQPATPQQKRISDFLVKNILEIRKAGIGIIFATQNIVGFRTQLYRNLTWRIYATGLGVGADGKYLAEMEGRHALRVYDSIPNPRTTGTYGVMLAGPIQSLSAKQPMLMSMDADNAVLLANNPPLPTPPPRQAPARTAATEPVRRITRGTGTPATP